jgi:chromate reductase
MSKKVGIIVGSLRRGSFTKTIAKAAAGLFPADVEVKFVEIAHLPLYNQDYDDEGRAPESYTAYRKEIESMDGFVFATPEHNRSLPAALKNALDIASRPYGSNKFDGKPAAIISVSPGAMGGFGANHHLRQVFTFLNVYPVQQPEVYIGSVHTLMDEKGNVAESTKELLKSVISALVKKL